MSSLPTTTTAAADPPVTISFTGPASLMQSLTDALCALYNYQPQIPDPANPGQTISNPQTAAEFARQKIIEYCIEVVKSYQARQASDVARKQAIDAVTAQVSSSTITASVQ